MVATSALSAPDRVTPHTYTYEQPAGMAGAHTTNQEGSGQMGFKLPDTLPTDADGLAQLRAEAVDAFNEIYGDGTGAPSAEEFAEMKAITDAITALDDAAAEMSAADERAASAAEMAAALAAKADEATGEDTDDDDEPADADATVDEEAVNEPEEERAPVEEVTASGRTRFTDAANGQTPGDVPTTPAGFRLTTSAKNYQAGIVDSGTVAREFLDIAHGRAARVIGAGGRTDTTIAYIERQVPAEFTIGDDTHAHTVLEHATSEHRLPGGSLVAAGGWCAPSETMYDFLPTGAPSGILSLPEVSIKRGGVKFPKEPDFDKLYDDVGFHQTEAQAQAGTEKTCIEIPCGEFEELRLDAVGLCITGGILQDKAWPELTKKFVDEAMRLHEHKLNAHRIKTVADGSTAVTGFTGTIGAAGAVLATLELQVHDMRARHRLSRDESLEGMAPEWLLGVLRADLAYRDEVLPERVTDQHIIDHFRDRGANLQFVKDWQTDVIGAKTPAKAWPATVQVALWKAGTWWMANEPVVNLGVTYDAAMLKKNQRIQLFTEDGTAVGKRGVDSRLLTIPVAVNGQVGLRVDVAGAGTGG